MQIEGRKPKNQTLVLKEKGRRNWRDSQVGEGGKGEPEFILRSPHQWRKKELKEGLVGEKKKVRGFGGPKKEKGRCGP